MTIPDGYGRMACYNLMTKESVGYMGKGGPMDASIALVDKEDSVGVRWESDGGDVYLVKETSPQDRYLAEGNEDYASWDLPANIHHYPVVLNDDGTISQKANLNRKLYGPVPSLGTNWLAWTSDKANSNILAFKLED